MKSTSETSPSSPDPIAAVYVRQLLGAISHDLRAPSRQVKSFSQLLTIHLGGDVDDDTREYLDLIDTAADTLHAKLEAVTRLSSIVATDVELVPCGLAQVIDEAARFVDSNPSTINRVNSETMVLADPKLLVIVFQELLGNCVRFCDPGGTISVTSETQDGSCVITVDDEGPGFDAADPTRAFDLFKRFHGASYQGEGAGLTISQAILRRHRSKLVLTTSRDAGTSVSFTLSAAGQSIPS